MKKDPGMVFRILLMLGDAASIVLSFAFAYYLRTQISTRPYYFDSELKNFVLAIVMLIPIWLVILALLGLYQKNTINGRRFPEMLRLLAASVIGIMAIITYDFFFGGSDLFPVRTIALYAMLSCFVFLCIFRIIIRWIRHLIVKAERGHGALNAIIIGNSKNTSFLADQINDYPDAGYRITGIVSGKHFIPKGMKNYHYSSLKEALKKAKADVIFQTDEHETDYVYKQAINHHLLYYFVPSETALSSHMGQLELIGDTPAILVKVTPLIGGAKIIKRISDIVLSVLALIVAIIPMGIIWLIIKLSDIKHSAIYKDIRLSRYNRKFKLYKFRSMKPEYSGMSPEEAFRKMGKPGLIKKYRDNGDYLEKDPRITGIGRFIRATSLDELPQLFNVLKGDISFVGPRALVPGELRNYGDRSLLLSVKSGLTGLAQVSGRRDISFEERRSLDLYYIQNWSLLLDVQIILRTFAVVLGRKGAK
ncbi:sugar transferase [Candidatus Saccharibacteria bacterium]|jgi:exopolysaccharide biosynthesis polyprenyl glycosylphosphotransferase|nr:sugar transferase [Candidatus Saccharibacteria bacterium]